jgi:hypothetical protein
LPTLSLAYWYSPVDQGLSSSPRGIGVIRVIRSYGASMTLYMGVFRVY